MNSLTKRVNGSGVGAVLLDGGMGRFNTYTSQEDYERTTGRTLRDNNILNVKKEGKGLADKIGTSLSKVGIQKKKNIVLDL
jgi:hypothetical protein